AGRPCRDPDWLTARSRIGRNCSRSSGGPAGDHKAGIHAAGSHILSDVGIAWSGGFPSDQTPMRSFTVRVATVLLGLVVIPVSSSAQTSMPQSSTPPAAARRPHVDTVHGDIRSDDYFWLREKSDPAVSEYLN